jgi:predicted component of type VI protein secretion system
LPWDQAAVAVEPASAGGSGGQPTHLLFGHNAFSLRGEPLVLGSQASDDGRWLDFQQDMPGVSRRHCVVSPQNGQYIVTDHSRYGTFLNGHRIDGSAVLQTGDLIRIGTPGFELRLIAAEDHRGS